MSPELFDILDGYVDSLQRGAVNEEEIDDGSPALVFCHNFFAQFFRSVAGVEIQSVDVRGKVVAVRQRRKLKEKGEPPETIQLVTWFEKLCDIHPDVVRMGYGGPPRESLANFHLYLLRLLQRIAAWARVKHLDEIHARADGGFSALKNAIK